MEKTEFIFAKFDDASVFVRAIQRLEYVSEEGIDARGFSCGGACVALTYASRHRATLVELALACNAEVVQFVSLDYDPQVEVRMEFPDEEWAKRAKVSLSLDFYVLWEKGVGNITVYAMKREVSRVLGIAAERRCVRAQICPVEG